MEDAATRRHERDTQDDRTSSHHGDDAVEHDGALELLVRPEGLHERGRVREACPRTEGVEDGKWRVLFSADGRWGGGGVGDEEGRGRNVSAESMRQERGGVR